MLNYRHSAGFTLIELLVIIAVIAILATIGVLSYNGWRQNTAASVVTSDLLSASAAMKQSLNFSSKYPGSLDELSATFQPSDDVSLSLTLAGGDGYPVYSNLSNTQNGVLFHSICPQLVAEGYGKGTNNGGASEQYISGCNVYNNDMLQVNSAWSGHNLSTPVTAAALPDIVNGINYNDSYRPGRDQVEKDFYQTWHERFLAMGGQYPIDVFWDDWCGAGCSWGVPKEPLPTPVGNVSDADRYCIQALSLRYPALVMHVTDSSTEPTEGNC